MKPVAYKAHPSAVIDDGCDIGRDVTIWHFSHLMPGCRVGDGCTIGQNVMIGPKVVLGKNVKVQNNVSIFEGVTCEDDVFLGPSMVFTNVINPRSAISRKHAFMPTMVRKGASIGANSTIICGNEIGRYAFVGAGSVVTKSVADYALVVGNPARQVGWMSEHGCPLKFDAAGHAKCHESGETYSLVNNMVQKISTP